MSLKSRKETLFLILNIFIVIKPLTRYGWYLSQSGAAHQYFSEVGVGAYLAFEHSELLEVVVIQ